MILVTGASGKTGIAVVNALSRRGALARALVHRDSYVETLLTAGASEVIVGDMAEPEDMNRAMDGASAVYHICPNMHPGELDIGMIALSAAREKGLRRFVFHSVLHPQTSEMAHHWSKLRVEEQVFSSGLEFTILQPCAYMQNVIAYLDSVRETGIYAVPYAASTRISMVDLEDVAEVAALVLTQNGHDNAIYELAGPQAMSQDDIAVSLSGMLQREVVAQATDRGEWDAKMKQIGMADYARSTLLSMFRYYERYNFIGNANVLAFLLERSPRSFAGYLSTL